MKNFPQARPWYGAAAVGPRDTRIPPRCPRSNCLTERFVRTIRAEPADRIPIFNQRHLSMVLTTYVQHYNGRRPHRAHELRPPQPTHAAADLSQGRIKRRPVLAGLINERYS